MPKVNPKENAVTIRMDLKEKKSRLNSTSNSSNSSNNSSVSGKKLTLQEQMIADALQCSDVNGNKTQASSSLLYVDITSRVQSKIDIANIVRKKVTDTNDSFIAAERSDQPSGNLVTELN